MLLAIKAQSDMLVPVLSRIRIANRDRMAIHHPSHSPGKSTNQRQDLVQSVKNNSPWCGCLVALQGSTVSMRTPSGNMVTRSTSKQTASKRLATSPSTPESERHDKSEKCCWRSKDLVVLLGKHPRVLQVKVDQFCGRPC